LLLMFVEDMLMALIGYDPTGPSKNSVP
jgi:hypothetical protein